MDLLLVRKLATSFGKNAKSFISDWSLSQTSRNRILFISLKLQTTITRHERSLRLLYEFAKCSMSPFNTDCELTRDIGVSRKLPRLSRDYKSRQKLEKESNRTVSVYLSFVRSLLTIDFRITSLNLNPQWTHSEPNTSSYFTKPCDTDRQYCTRYLGREKTYKRSSTPVQEKIKRSSSERVQIAPPLKEKKIIKNVNASVCTKSRSSFCGVYAVPWWFLCSWFYQPRLYPVEGNWYWLLPLLAPRAGEAFLMTGEILTPVAGSTISIARSYLSLDASTAWRPAGDPEYTAIGDRMYICSLICWGGVEWIKEPGCPCWSFSFFTVVSLVLPCRKFVYIVCVPNPLTSSSLIIGQNSMSSSSSKDRDALNRALVMDTTDPC